MDFCFYFAGGFDRRTGVEAHCTFKTIWIKWDPWDHYDRWNWDGKPLGLCVFRGAARECCENFTCWIIFWRYFDPGVHLGISWSIMMESDWDIESLDLQLDGEQYIVSGQWIWRWMAGLTRFKHPLSDERNLGFFSSSGCDMVRFIYLPGFGKARAEAWQRQFFHGVKTWAVPNYKSIATNICSTKNHKIIKNPCIWFNFGYWDAIDFFYFIWISFGCDAPLGIGPDTSRACDARSFTELRQWALKSCWLENDQSMFTLGVIKTLGTMWINKLFIFVEGNLIEPFTIHCLQCLGKAKHIHLCQGIPRRRPHSADVRSSHRGAGQVVMMPIATSPYLTRNHV